MARIPTHRPPIHPGEILLEDFLKPLGITQRQLSDALQMPYQRVNEIVNGRRGITPATALRLAKYFGTSEAFWMNLQVHSELYRARRSEARVLTGIKRHARAPSPTSG